ncbi:putative ubiquitin-like-specific protease 1B [Magnolia sinica]|nr:putative ubiquitin-like-specific protease 1B [Magnolia sinica]
MEYQLDLLRTYGAGNHKDRGTLKSRLSEVLIQIVDCKPKPLWKYDVVYIPLNARGHHWLMAAVYPRKKEVTLYDSLSIELEEKNKLVVAQVTDGLRWLFHVLDGGLVRWEKPWNVKPSADRPAQHNSDDCGVFMLKYIDFLCSMSAIDFTLEEIPKFRKTIAYDCLQ